MIKNGRIHSLTICTIVLLVGSLMSSVTEAPASDIGTSNNVPTPITMNRATIRCSEILSTLWIKECESCVDGLISSMQVVDSKWNGKDVWMCSLRDVNDNSEMGIAILDKEQGQIILSRIPTNYEKQLALERAKEWLGTQGGVWEEPERIVWVSNGSYQLHFKVNDREMALLGPAILSVHPTLGEPQWSVRR